MNRFFLRFLVVTTLFCLAQTSFAGQVIISTQVANPTDYQIGLAYKKTESATQNSFFKVDLGATFELHMDAAKFVELHYAQQIIPLYLEIDDVITISFDGTNVLQTIRFDGKGAGNNTVLANYRKQFRSPQQTAYEGGYLTATIDQSVAQQARAATANSFATAIQTAENQQNQFLNQHKSQLSSFLYQYLQTEIKYSNATNRAAWFLEHRYESLQRSKTVINVLKSVSLSKGDLLSHPTYTNFLKMYLFYMYLPEDLSRYKTHYPLYEIVEKNYSGKPKFYMQTELMVQVYNRSGEVEFAQKHFRDFVNQNVYPSYTEQLQEVYGAALSGTADVGAPDFDMMDANRNVLALSDYKGKVVYLSFWASWCKPCIEGFKKSAATRERLQEMGVVLLNVSIDKNESAWREAMLRHSPSGINGLVLSLEDISKKYSISSIPLYEIIGKDGKFAYLSDNAQRDIIEEFRQLVKK